MPTQRPIVLIHGYSDSATSFEPWRTALIAAGHPASDVHLCEYKTLTNEVTIKDIAEGFDRALRIQTGLGPDAEFDAVVHSTGMLVIRAWLAAYPRARTRLKRLIALAPATNGSPWAHKGRGLLGALFKGNRVPGPDFMEAGREVLDALELGSRFTWDLAHVDLLDPVVGPFYTPEPTTPYVFILCGTAGLGRIVDLVAGDGTDGVVRLAGCSLDIRKITFDMTTEPVGAATSASDRVARDAAPMPVHLIPKKNHSTILSRPDGPLLDLVLSALRVDNKDGFSAWQKQAGAITKEARRAVDQFQQFVVRAIDDRGDPIRDYFIQLIERQEKGRPKVLPFDMSVHPYAADTSLRCFHVNLTTLKKKFPNLDQRRLRVRVVARSGSDLVGYHGVPPGAGGVPLTPGDDAWDAELALPGLFGEEEMTLFHPFTTTFVEVRLNRDPMPFGQQRNRVTYFP